MRFKDVLRHLRHAHRAVPAVPSPPRLVAVVARSAVLGRGRDSIDVEFHVRHIALPHPGDWRQLCIQVARLHSRPLDRSKPLWEAYVIEGLHNVDGVPAGSFALYTKMHHAIVDGESGTEIMKALHSLTPEVIDRRRGTPRAVYHARSRSDVGRDVLARARAQRAAVAEPRALLARHRAPASPRSAPALRSKINATSDGSLVSSVRVADDRRLEFAAADACRRRRDSAADVSAHRVFEAVALPMADFSAIRQQVPESRSTISSCASSVARCTTTCRPRRNCPTGPWSRWCR